MFFILYSFSDLGSKLEKLPPVGDYRLRSRKITPSTHKSSSVSEQLSTSTHTMNNQVEGVGNRMDHTSNDEEPPLDGAGEGQFVPRTLLDYAASRATDARGPIRLPHIIREPPSYDVSTISILQK
jgi:hypothetical protein